MLAQAAPTAEDIEDEQHRFVREAMLKVQVLSEMILVETNPRMCGLIASQIYKLSREARQTNKRLRSEEGRHRDKMHYENMGGMQNKVMKEVDQ